MSAPRVTQEDRDAAAAYWQVSRIGNDETQRRYLSGEADESFIVQAFARHRHKSEATGKAEIEGLRSYIVECDENALAERNALRGALAAIIADPDCCAASKNIARDALGGSQ